MRVAFIITFFNIPTTELWVLPRWATGKIKERGKAEKESRDNNKGEHLSASRTFILVRGNKNQYLLLKDFRAQKNSDHF